ncbi:hydantoinase/oxoprolinase family protein, partial [Streptococcus pneumoniae]|uniref:hydantoinase/oxoprolinase family protein n=1 Tax=Streptococcus pneumoniae TaxID=1313 RepID=UPI0019530CA7
EDVADSAIRIAVEAIVSAIRLISTSRGRDPRDYVLVPYGGAGPLHAAAVAEALAIENVLVPPNAGVLSAYGLLAADFSIYD